MLNDNPSTIDWIVKSGHYIPELRLISYHSIIICKKMKTNI